MNGVQAVSHDQYVVHGGNDGEGEGGAQKREAGDGDPSRAIDFEQQDEEIAATCAKVLALPKMLGRKSRSPAMA